MPHMTPDDIEQIEMYYFGYWDQPGHYLWSPQRMGVSPLDERVPSLLNAVKLDARYCRNPGAAWKGDEPEGLAYLHHVEIVEGEPKDAPFIGQKWTVLAFPDRSGDTRPGSNSAFLAKGVFTFQQMIIFARAHFPDVWKRISGAFDVQDIRTIR